MDSYEVYSAMVISSEEDKNPKICSRLSKVVFFSMACVFVLAAVWVLKSGALRDAQSEESPVAVYEIPRHVRYGFIIQNTTGQLVKNGAFYTWAPVRQTATQLCRRIDASHQFRLIGDDLGNQMLRFDLQDIPPFGTRLITIRADLSMSPTPNRSKPDNFSVWLRPERYIESNHPDMKRIIRKLTADTHKRTVERIFNWVFRHVQYSGYSQKERGALYAFSHKKGDCTEYMYLFTALCRAGSIPARGVEGYIVTGNSNLNPAAFHNWAEFYADGRWYPADPQNNVFMSKGQSFIAMRIISDSTHYPEKRFARFRVEGFGLSARMNGN
jgi:transglutaminase-like putative cysteine protease